MKLLLLCAGLAIGGVSGFTLANYLQQGHPKTITKSSNIHASDTSPWRWPDSLDAVKAAPKNHRIVFENDNVRILEVTLDPYESEQLHTHQLPSVMWSAENDAPHYDIIYYPYGYDSLRHVYFPKDSIQQHGGKQKGDAHFMKPEGPHRIKNLSNARIVAYRVEFKKP